VFDDPAEAQHLEHDPTFVPVSAAYPASQGAGYEELVDGRHAVEQPRYEAPITTVPANEFSHPLVPAASTVTMPESTAAVGVTVAPGDPYATMEMPAVAVAAPAAVAVISTPPVTLQANGSIPSPTVSPEAKTVTASSGPDVPRPIGGKTLDEHASFWGSLLGSFGLIWIVYTQLLPFTGRVGFVILWFFAFLAMYAGVSAMGNPSQVVKDRTIAAAIRAGAMIVGLALLSAVLFTFYRGIDALLHVNFFTQDMAGVRPTASLDKGGIIHAIVGSMIEIGIAVLFALPLGVGTAVFMNEVGGPTARAVRTVVEAMTALPSIVAGLFVYTVLIVTLGVSRTGIAAACAIFVMILPIIARASDVVLRVMPGGLREASLALGASKWQTVRMVVLPTVRPGLATALILGIARGVGETSPVLLTSGASTYFNANPFSEPMNSLPLFVFASVRSGEPLFIARGFGAAAVLLGLVLVLFIITRRLARTKVGNR
jgi:phosphate transport system permease protein